MTRARTRSDCGIVRNSAGIAPSPGVAFLCIGFLLLIGAGADPWLRSRSEGEVDGAPEGTTVVNSEFAEPKTPANARKSPFR